MAEPGIMEEKLSERIDWAMDIVKAKAKKEGIEFDKAIFLEGCRLGSTLFVRSEIAYSSKKR